MINHHAALEGFLRKPHSISQLIVHLIFTTRYRRKRFGGHMTDQLRDAFGSAAKKLECEMIKLAGEPDHVHLLVAYPPKLAVCVMVNNLKSVSSRLLRQQNTHLRMQGKTGLLWSGSYFVCTLAKRRLKRSEPVFRVRQHLTDI